jgi:hypothetical protein
MRKVKKPSAFAVDRQLNLKGYSSRREFCDKTGFSYSVLIGICGEDIKRYSKDSAIQLCQLLDIPFEEVRMP